uniref:Uncharacterized protein n=1 Tax=Rhodopseudomonas palustris (strain BisA53) TaxID=316055 RepID=Q07RI9_RHOP5
MRLKWGLNKPERSENRPGARTAKHRIFTTSFASVYPLYVAKAEKKGRTKAEVDQVINSAEGMRSTLRAFTPTRVELPPPLRQ